MPVTTRVSPVDVKFAPSVSNFTPSSLLQATCPTLWKSGNTILDSSFDPGAFDPKVNIYVNIRTGLEFTDSGGNVNGFVGTVLDSYLQHNHLVLRPDDIWFAIIIQFSFYINNHAEELRSHFVSHAGKRFLEIKKQWMDIRGFLIEMTDLLEENIKDPKLREWIMPDFTTTTANDKISAAIIMMGTMQKYFAYGMGITCGIPSVTLLGERSDWEAMLQRLEYLDTFTNSHPELEKWQSVLTPILTSMVSTFDSPDKPEVVKFWQSAVHTYRDDYAGEKHITGWLLAFCFWDSLGKPLVERRAGYRSDGWKKAVQKHGNGWWLEGGQLGSLGWDQIPSAFVHVPVHVKIETVIPKEKYVAKAVAGFVGWTVLDSELIFSRTRKGDSQDENGIANAPFLEEHFTQRLLGRDAQVKKGEVAMDNIPNGPAFEVQAPQISDLSELDTLWEHEAGGKHDTLQPVTGWWFMRTVDGIYGKDEDVPEVQFDSDAEDYDEELAKEGLRLEL